MILAIILLLIGAELLYSNYYLTSSYYSFSSDKINGSFRIVFLADLHGREFGKSNSRLLAKIEKEHPDLICLVGDIFNSNSDPNEITAMCDFIRVATDIAPVYFSLGNQDASYIREYGPGLLEQVNATGAIVLDNSYIDLTMNGTAVRIGGYMGYYRTPHMNTSDPTEQQQLSTFAIDFENSDCLKILLNHIPTNWLDWEYRNTYAVDLVLSGHYHGGVIRIPILEQGLYAPYVGKFPPYTKGMFVGKTATCVLTTGLAGSYGSPRIFNPPEIVVIDLAKTK